jgi:hypothetical protein
VHIVAAPTSVCYVKLANAAWITILIFTGSFQLYRDAIPDGIVFFAMAAALLVSLTGILNRFDNWRWQPRRAFVVIALAVAAAVLVLTPRQGITDGVVVVASGVLVFLVAWPSPVEGETRPSPWGPRMTRAAVAWSIAGILFCGWELAMYFLGYGRSGRTEYPALSDLFDPILNNPVGRVIGVAAWLAGGVSLARLGKPKPGLRVAKAKVAEEAGEAAG